MASDVIHAIVVLSVVLVAGALGLDHILSGSATVGVLSAAVGYAAGRSGTVSPGP